MNLLDLPPRMVKKIAVDPETGCWNWLGALTVGYGRIKYAGRVDMAHRVAYRVLVGPIPAGLDLDHLCRNQACVNPRHLDPVTRSVNMRRAHLAVASDLPGLGVEGVAAVSGLTCRQVYWKIHTGHLTRIAHTGRNIRVTPAAVEACFGITIGEAAS